MGDTTPSAGKLQGFAQATLHYVRARLDLLQYEMRQEQKRLQRLAANAGLFAIGALLTLQLLCGTVIIAFWDTPYRLHAAVALTMLFGAVTGYALRVLLSGGSDEAPFAATLSEFDKDREALGRVAADIAHEVPAAAKAPRRAVDEMVGASAQLVDAVQKARAQAAAPAGPARPAGAAPSSPPASQTPATATEPT